KLVFCRLGRQLRIAGLAELGCRRNVIDPRRVDVLIRAARARLPKAAEWNSDPRPWCGLRPMTPDSRPIVGLTPIANLFVNCGHGMLGWTLACGSAELVASELLAEPPGRGPGRVVPADFSLSRFTN